MEITASGVDMAGVLQGNQFSAELIFYNLRKFIGHALVVDGMDSDDTADRFFDFIVIQGRFGKTTQFFKTY